MSVGGSLTRPSERDAVVNEQQSHLANIGSLIEVRYSES
jgi:hypothetical protein